MQNIKTKTNQIIVVAVIMGLVLVALSGIIIAEAIVAMKGTTPDLYAIIFAPLACLYVFCITPFFAVIGYEGMDFSALAPTNAVFWFWLFLIVFLSCMIALLVLLLQRNRLKRSLFNDITIVAGTYNETQRN